MAAKSGNKSVPDKLSMAAELLNVIGEEEYVTDIPGFPSTGYLNKTDLSSIKKMVSGKLWLDSRKFISRQNTVIVNGMFALFGLKMGKTASDLHAEACDHFLDPENQSLRQTLCDSINRGGKSYSMWIRRLSSDNYPCDEYGIYLLSYTFRQHVIVVLADKLWCTFKCGSMSTFEKICKSDHVLLWLGDNKYSEIKPLHVTVETGNIAEWQRLAESIDHVHERNQSAKHNRRISRATASVKTPTKKIVSPPPTRSVNKRDRKASIDYKQLHEEGIYTEKKRKVEKYPPLVSGPSDSRIASQQHITCHKKSPQTTLRDERDTGTTEARKSRGYIPLRPVNVTRRTIKQERVQYDSTRIVKPEPGIYMCHRERPSDKDRQWRYVHVSGRKCRQGGSHDCNSQSENEAEDETLPDLTKQSHP